MKNKDLKKEFLNYIEYIKKQEYSAILDNELRNSACMLFGEDSIHVNNHNKTLFIKPLNLLFEHINGELKDISWVGLIQQPNNNTLKLIIGFDNPYVLSEHHKDFIMQYEGKQFIKAVPFILMQTTNKSISKNVTQTKLQTM